MIQGYQSQGGKSTGVVTVEDDLREALGRSCVAAGRTDKVVTIACIISLLVHLHVTSGYYHVIKCIDCYHCLQMRRTYQLYRRWCRFTPHLKL
jgi:tRNA U38,U39,U40 pseudouridine synthase TruA